MKLARGLLDELVITLFAGVRCSKPYGLMVSHRLVVYAVQGFEEEATVFIEHL
jgi:hypothetical protein